jgi:cytochrome c oxidase subunit IV
MKSNKLHKAEYTDYLKISILLLLLTACNIIIAGLGHSGFISGVIIAVAVIQGAITLIWFMHLDIDSRLMRVFVGGVFLLFIIVIVITFFDYSFR